MLVYIKVKSVKKKSKSNVVFNVLKVENKVLMRACYYTEGGERILL